MVLSSSIVFSAYYVSEQGMFTDHFNAFFYYVAQVYQGKALLIDFMNQYGLYPHILYSIFKVTGLSVYTFTVTMAVLLFASYACMLVFLYLVTKNKAIAATGFISTATGFISTIFYSYVLQRFIFPDPFTVCSITDDISFSNSCFIFCIFQSKQYKNKKLFIYSFLYRILYCYTVESGCRNRCFLSWMLLFYRDISQYNGWNIAKK
jgi:hypothetical protein